MYQKLNHNHCYTFRYVNENIMETPFKDIILGDEFLTRFKRTFNLTQKKPQIVEVTSVTWKLTVDTFIISDYFTPVKEYAVIITLLRWRNMLW